MEAEMLREGGADDEADIFKSEQTVNYRDDTEGQSGQDKISS